MADELLAALVVGVAAAEQTLRDRNAKRFCAGAFRRGVKRSEAMPQTQMRGAGRAASPQPLSGI